MDATQTALDERLERALAVSNYRLTQRNQINLAKRRLNENLSFAINGGQFVVTQTLIAFVHALEQHTSGQSIIINDVNDMPITIENSSEFLETVVDRYFAAHNNYAREMAKLTKKSRTSSAVVGVE